jgi:flagellar hook-length control protein FliK
MQRISQSELRVGIPSDFGDIAVRTAMNRHQLSAEISVQHAGLRDAIVAEMPSLQARLSEQHIPMTNVSVTANAGDGSNGGANSFQQWSHNGQQTAKSSTSLAGEGSNDRDSAASVDVLERGAGLDIRI